MVKEYAPKDAELHRIAKGLQEVQKKWFYGLVGSVKHQGHYYHEFCTVVDVCKRDEQEWFSTVPIEVQDELTDLLRDFMRWIYRTLQEEYEYLSSDEQVLEMLDANEYDFTEDGEIF